MSEPGRFEPSASVVRHHRTRSVDRHILPDEADTDAVARAFDRDTTAAAFARDHDDRLDELSDEERVAMNLTEDW